MKGQTNALGNTGLIINVIADDGTFMDGQIVTIAKKETATPDYNAIDEYGVAIMDINGKFYQTKDAWQAAGKPTANGIAISDGTHRFCIAKTMVEHVCSTSSNRDSEYLGAYNMQVRGIITTTDATIATQDFNGVANTDAIIANVTSSDGYFTKSPWSAAGLCRQYTFPDSSNGYLGAVGEWQMVQNKINEVNTLMLIIGGVQLDVSSYPYYWSSTQYSSKHAWLWAFNNADCGYGEKSGNFRVRAFSEIKSFTTKSKEYIVKNGMVSVPVEKGTEYVISVNDKEGYTTPQSVTYNTSTGTKHITLQYIYSPTVDLSMQDIYGNLIAQTTANCYVVSKADTYKIPLVFGNALKNGSTNSAAYTKNSGSYSHDFVDYNGTKVTSPYIETVSGAAASAQLSIADTDGIFTDISIVDGSPCRYLQFKVASVPATGANGVLSVKNSSGVIMWSWHIWVWADSLATVEITNSTSVKYKILPVNLASKWDDTAKTKIKNWYYQFGRPNPMLCPSAYNSTRNHASYGALSYAAASIASDIQTGIKNPATFYKHSSSYNYNWFQANSGKTYNLWDAACTSTGNSDNNVVKTIYDPCPIGFKMPNGNVFTGFSTSNVVGSFANGYKFKRYSGDTVGVFFPASGYRNFSDGSLNYVGSYGYVWLSSAHSQGSAYGLSFTSGYVNLQSLNYRARGFSVRPVADDSTIQPVVIVFSFRNKTYQAELGMTWNDWVNSSYYDNTLYISGNRIIDGSYCLLDNGNAEVTPSQTILPISYGYGLY